MDEQDIAARMRHRIALCRNLADTTSGPTTAKALREIAEEGQRDRDELLRGDSRG